jgi:hypothetical protein
MEQLLLSEKEEEEVRMVIMVVDLVKQYRAPGWGGVRKMTDQ